MIDKKLAEEIEAELQMLASSSGRSSRSFGPEHDDYILRARSMGASWRAITPAFQKRFGFGGRDTLTQRHNELVGKANTLDKV
jgi:hypothetical protein